MTDDEARSGLAPAAGPVLEAVRVERIAALGRVFGWAAARKPALVTYSVDVPGEKRTSHRMRVRLRSGKLADGRDRFLTECLIFDLSARGARLQLERNVAIPEVLRLYDDRDDTLVEAARLDQGSPDRHQVQANYSGAKDRY